MGEFLDSFAGLTPDEKHQRYLCLAKAALAHYDVGEVNIRFIEHSGGVTFRVEPKGDSRRFLLKIHEPVSGAGQKREHIESRLLWLAAVRRDTEIIVQEPVPNRTGHVVTEVSFDDLRQLFNCTLQRWIEGEHRDGDLTPTQAHRIGVMMAQLHQHGRQWELPKRLVLPKYNSEEMHASLKALRPAVSAGAISIREFAIIEEAVQHIDKLRTALGEEKPVWGLIHGDFHPEHVLFYRDAVRPIDFDDCGFGYCYFDLGYLLYYCLHDYADPEVRSSLLSGYQSVCKLPDDHQYCIEAFSISGALSNLSWHIRQIAIPSIKESLARHLPHFVERQCHKFIRGEPYLFE